MDCGSVITSLNFILSHGHTNLSQRLLCLALMESRGFQCILTCKHVNMSSHDVTTTCITRCNYNTHHMMKRHHAYRPDHWKPGPLVVNVKWTAFKTCFSNQQPLKAPHNIASHSPNHAHRQQCQSRRVTASSSGCT